MSNEILTECDGEVTHITLNRPSDGNGVTNEMAVELTQILAEAGETSHFVTLRGSGEDFCTGRAGMGRRPEGRPEALDLRHQNDVIFNCYGAFRNSPAPIVGVVMSLPDTGPLFLHALLNQDMYLAGAMVLVYCSLTIIGTFVSDLLLIALDPRIRMEGNY